MSNIIKGREILLEDSDKIKVELNGAIKDVDVQWYLEKVDNNVYPIGDDHTIDYILGVYSHINDYDTTSDYPMDRIYFFMIHNLDYKMYSDPEGISVVVKLRDVKKNSTLFEKTYSNIRYTNYNTFNSIMYSNKSEYEKFNGIPKNKYKDIINYIGDRDKCLIVDTARIETDPGDNNPLSKTCYLYSDKDQVTLKLIYPKYGEIIELFDIDHSIKGVVGVPQYIITNPSLENYSNNYIKNYDKITTYPEENLNNIASIINKTAFYQFISAQSMFASKNGTTSFSSLDLSNINFEKLYDMSSMLNGCSSLSSLVLGSNFTTKNANNLAGLFNGCSALSNMNVEFDLSSIVSINNVSNMFSGCNMNSGRIVFTNVSRSIFEDGNKFVEAIDGKNITSVLKVCFDDGEEVTEFDTDSSNMSGGGE